MTSIDAQESKPEPILLDAPVRDVLVFKNGTKIIREGKVKIPASEGTAVALKFLPRSIDESTVKVSGKGKVPGRIKSMNIEDHHEQESNKAEIEAREQELEAMREKDTVLQRKIEYHQARKADLVKFKESFLQKFPFVEADDYPAKYLLQQADKPAIPAVKSGLEDFVKNADEIIAGTTTKLFALVDEQAELREKIDVAQRQLDQLRNKSGVKTYKQVVVDVSAQKEGEFTFTIEYVIHAGFWTPLYEVYLADESSKVAIKVIAGVTNNTEEDWDSVQLTVSSADLKPVVMREPDPWILREWHAMPTYPKAEMSGRRDMALGGMPPPAPPGGMVVAASTVPLLPADQPVIAKPPAEVGGSASAGVITFKLPSKLSIKQGSFRNNIYLLDLSLDGKAEFFYSTDNAKLIIQNVIKNGDMQFLPGQAKIYVGDDYIGETSMNAVLPGEEFTLGTREAHDLKIEKKLVDRSTDKGGLAKGKTVRYYSYEITIEILSDAARKNELVLMDKMPYSDSELVKVTGPTGLQYQPDETKLGVMKFRLKLADLEKKTKIAYEYEISNDKDVILDTSLP